MNKTLEQEIDCLNIKNKGLNLEYEYVIDVKNKEICDLKEKIIKLNIDIQEQNEEIKVLNNKIKGIKDNLEQKEQKIISIENSRWWKLRNFLKNDNSKKI